ncbi:MAG: DUF2892 domain-containing protein [Marinibacterium sp.]|nr:DUF2892 domain-containing protein [Marinibacterium sp.]
MFAKNVGSLDRLVRIILGALLVVGALMGLGAWMWIGVIALATGLLNTCPLYSLLGINTCSR